MISEENGKNSQQALHNPLGSMQYYLFGLSTVRPPPTTTTFGPHNKNRHWKNSSISIKLIKMKKLRREINEEADKYTNVYTLPDYYT
jgi:hypothetical protein